MDLSLLAKLKQRRAVRAVVAYGIVAFAVLQVVEPVMHGLHWPDAVLTWVLVALAAGFPCVVGIAFMLDSGWKMPARRRVLAAIAVASFAVASTVLIVLRPRDLPAPSQRIAVAVADFANDTDDRDLNSLSGMLITSLEQSRRLLVLTRSRMVDLLRELGHEQFERIDESLGREVARRARVRALVLASIHRFDDVYAIELKVLDPASDEYLFTLKEQERGKSRIPDMVDRLSQRTREMLRETPAEVRDSKVRVGEAITGNLEAYAHYVRGVQYQEGSRIDAALDEYRAAIALDPDFAVAHYRIAYAGMFSILPGRVLREEIQKAVGHIEQMPEKERLLVEGWKANLDRKPDLAAALYARAAARFPDDKQVPFMAGEFLIHQGRPVAALPYFEQAVALQPAWEWARAHVVDCMLEIGRAPELLARVKDWVRIKPDADTYRWQARAELGNGAWAEAAESARRSMELLDQASIAGYQSRLTLADALTYTGALDEAESVLRAGLVSSAPPSEQSRLMTLLAEVLTYQGRLRESKQIIDGLGAMGANEALVAGLHLVEALGQGQPMANAARAVSSAGIGGGQLVVLLAWSGELETAERMAVALVPASAEQTLYRALVAWRRGDTGAAAAGFRALGGRLDHDHSALASLAMGEMAFSQGRWPEAIAALESFCAAYLAKGRGFAIGVPPPELFRAAFGGYFRSWMYPRALYLMAAAHAHLGHRTEAKQTLQRLLTLRKRADPGLSSVTEATALLTEVAQGHR